MSQSASKSQRYVEIFTTNNQLLLNKWKTHPSVKKLYDEDIKTFVYTLKCKSPVPLMHWPKEKMNGDISHPVVVFQIYFALGANILIDIGTRSLSGLRKRISLSTNLKNGRLTTLSIALPITARGSKCWSHLFLDLESIVSSAWKNEIFRSIDTLSLGGVCQLKRIFALKRDMIHNQDGTWLIKYEKLPKQMWLPQSIPQTYDFIPYVCVEDMLDCKYEDTKSLKSNPSFKNFSSTSTSYSSISSIRDCGSSVDSRNKIAPTSRSKTKSRLSTKAINRTKRGNELITEEDGVRNYGETIIPDLSKLSLYETHPFISFPNERRTDRVIQIPQDISPLCFQDNIFIPPASKVITEELKSQAGFRNLSNAALTWNGHDLKSIETRTDRLDSNTLISGQNITRKYSTSEVVSSEEKSVPTMEDGLISNPNKELAL